MFLVEKRFGPNFQSRDPRLEATPMDDFTGEPDLPSISDEVLRTVVKDNETRKIDIDSVKREIRTYGEKAFVLLGNDPRSISFEKDVPCNVIFDQGQFRLTLYTGESYRELKIDGTSHRIKLGHPTQELLIDGKGYQCYFGGKAISVHLAKKDRFIRLEGRPPKVDIGKHKNTDYVAGQVELVIQDKKVVPLFLDAKPQRFSIDGIPFVIKFIDSFKAVAINGVQFPVEFGGNPIFINVRGFRRRLRFMNLPPGIVPGKMNIKGMDVDGTTLIPSYPSSPPHSMPSSMHSGGQMAPTSSYSNHPYQGHHPPPPVPPSGAPIRPGAYMTSAPYSAPNLSNPAPDSSTPSTGPSLDVQSLLSQLKKAGIIGSATKGELKTPVEKKPEVTKPVEIDEEDVDDLKDLPRLPYMFELENLRK